MDPIIQMVDEHAAQRKTIKVSDYEFLVQRNHCFYTEQTCKGMLQKLLLLFVRDTEIETEKGNEQIYFWELDKDSWKLSVTTKTRVELDTEDILGLEEEDENKDAEPKYVETKMEIVILEDDESEDRRCVFFRHVSGAYVVGQEAEIRANKMIQDIMVE